MGSRLGVKMSWRRLQGAMLLSVLKMAYALRPKIQAADAKVFVELVFNISERHLHTRASRSAMPWGHAQHSELPPG